MAPPAERRGLFGVRTASEWEVVQLPVQACLTGREEGCLDALLDETQWSNNFFVQRTMTGPALYVPPFYGPAPLAIDHWFADLEAELGTEEFGRMWRSDEPIETTLDRSLEAGAAGWVVDWARSRYGVEPRGPRLDVANLTLTLLTIALMLVLSIGVARRRTIG